LGTDLFSWCMEGKKRGAMIKRSKIFQGRLLELSLLPHRFPSGYTETLEVINHPGAALVVAYMGKDRIVFLRQYRPVISRFIWELPAGTLSKEEPPLQCAKRELEEETGYRARFWKKLGVVYPAPGYTNERIHIYKASFLQKGLSKNEKDELIRVRLFTPKKIRYLFEKGRIVDAKTICALTLAGVI